MYNNQVCTIDHTANVNNVMHNSVIRDQYSYTSTYMYNYTSEYADVY